MKALTNHIAATTSFLAATAKGASCCRAAELVDQARKELARIACETDTLDPRDVEAADALDHIHEQLNGSRGGLQP